MTDETKQIGFRGTREYRAMLQQEALNRGIKVQRLLELAVEQFLKSKSGVTSTERRQESTSSELSNLTPEDLEFARVMLSARKEGDKHLRVILNELFEGEKPNYEQRKRSSSGRQEAPRKGSRAAG